VSAHTPGPWTLGRDDDGAVYAGDEFIANAYGFYVDGAYTTTPETVANARLIAAAPDLYRELAHLVRMLEPIEDTLGAPGLATLNGARAALEKVTA
jgi:hypothetical protein